MSLVVPIDPLSRPFHSAHHTFSNHPMWRGLLSKAFLLAADRAIMDPTILRQLAR